MGIFKKDHESFRHYFRRVKNGLVWRILPSVRERHRLAKMVGPSYSWETRRKFQFNLLMKMGLKPHHTLLDIGCGPLSAGLAIIPYLEPGNYAGIDIRPEAIAEAHVQIAKAGLAERDSFIAVSSTFGKNELGDRKFDYVWASALIYHLNDDQLADCLAQVSARMRPSSLFYCDVLGTYDNINGDCRWQGFPFFKRPIESYQSMAENHGLEMIRLRTLQDYGYPRRMGMKRNHLLEFHKKT